MANEPQILNKLNELLEKTLDVKEEFEQGVSSVGTLKSQLLQKMADLETNNQQLLTQLQAQAAEIEQLKTVAIGTNRIPDGAITRPKIGANAVDGSKIQDGSIGTAELANGAVNNAKIANGSINSAKLADKAVDNAKLADGVRNKIDTVFGRHIHSVRYATREFNFPSGDTGFSRFEIEGNSGEIALGAGWQLVSNENDSFLVPLQSYPSNNMRKWTIKARNRAGGHRPAGTVKMYVIFAKVG